MISKSVNVTPIAAVFMVEQYPWGEQIPTNTAQGTTLLEPCQQHAGGMEHHLFPRQNSQGTKAATFEHGISRHKSESSLITTMTERPHLKHHITYVLAYYLTFNL